MDSYDENILVWDTRNMRHLLCSSNPGGGVWRIKWHPLHGKTMLTACMYKGFHILKFNNSNGMFCDASGTKTGGKFKTKISRNPLWYKERILWFITANNIALFSPSGEQCLEKVASYKEQASLAYGADWCRKDIQCSKDLNRQTISQSKGNQQLKDFDLEKNEDKTYTDLVATCSFYDHALNLWAVKQ